jgi:Concanavalin A-like lectin/glucanases superfamily
MTTRRGFLKAILAAAVAPAIVRAESLMPIYVPKQEIFTFSGCGDYLDMPFDVDVSGDFTIETWARPVDDWRFLAMTRDCSGMHYYIDNQEASAKEFSEATGGKKVLSIKEEHVTLDPNRNFNGFLDDLRITNGVARSKETLLINQENPALLVPVCVSLFGIPLGAAEA